MDWNRGGEHWLESDCKRYTVSRATVAGARRYTAWFTVGEHSRALAYTDNATESKTACEHHAGFTQPPEEPDGT